MNSPKKEHPDLESEQGLILSEEKSVGVHLSSVIPTQPIMISNGFTTGQAHCYPRKKSAPPQILQEDLVHSLHAFSIATEDCLPPNFQRRRASVDETMLSQRYSSAASPQLRSTFSPQLQHQLSERQGPHHSNDKRIVLYKTEMCRTFEETGICKYGPKCQFAHDKSELRNIQRHPRYKTETCRTFWEQGNCPYGKRCCFIHTENEVHTLSSPVSEISEEDKANNNQLLKEQSLREPESVLDRPQKGAESKMLARIHKHEHEHEISSSFPAFSHFELKELSIPKTRNRQHDSFLDIFSAGPIGSPSNSSYNSALVLGSMHIWPGGKSMGHDCMMERASMPSDEGSSDSPWDDDTAGLLPSDLIQNA